MARTYSISELAREFDVTTRTIRFYEDEGLLAPERRGQTRIYSSRDRVLLKLILRGKRLGFSLAECGELFNLYDPEHDNQAQYQLMLDKLAERRRALEQQLNDIRLMQIELDTAEARIRAAQAGKPFSDDALDHVVADHDMHPDVTSHS
ncbi:MAG: MerR family DNA-binding transcriptional regulator [Pedobacter sp.]|nr:MerR family DNA-binding transcriptional regulator [Pedobacter sp.]